MLVTSQIPFPSCAASGTGRWYAHPLTISMEHVLMLSVTPRVTFDEIFFLSSLKFLIFLLRIREIMNLNILGWRWTHREPSIRSNE